MLVIKYGIDLSKCTQIVNTVMPKCSETHLHLGILIFCHENKVLPSGPELCELVLELKEQREEIKNNWKQNELKLLGGQFSLNCMSTLREIDAVIFNFKELYDYFGRRVNKSPKKKVERPVKDTQIPEEKQTYIKKKILQQFNKMTSKCQQVLYYK